MSTPAAAYDSPWPPIARSCLSAGPGLRIASVSPRSAWGPQAGGYSSSHRGERGVLKLHFVHLKLLRDRDWVGAVEACTAELLRRAAPDRLHEPRDGEVVQGVGADVAADLIDRPARGDELLGRADVDTHEAGIAHGRARDAHVDLARPHRTQALDGPLGGRAANDGIIDRDDALALDRSRQGVQLQHHACFAQRLVRLDEGPVDVAALHHRLAEGNARGF